MHLGTGALCTATNHVQWRECAADRGGGLSAEEGSEVVMSHEVSVTGCTATSDGGALHVASSRLSTELGVALLACTAQRGAALAASGSSLVRLSDTAIRDFEGQQAVVHARSGVKLHMLGVSASNCTTHGIGGLVHAMQDVTAHVSGSTLRGIHARGSGGVLYHEASSLTLVDSSFEACSSAEHGGVVAISGSALRMDGCILVQCSAGKKGGAIFAGRRGLVHVDASRFEHLHARLEGGAIKAEASVAISNSIFFNCSSRGLGGALRVHAMFDDLDPARVSSLVARSSFLQCSSGADGGASSSNQHRMPT